MANATTNVGTPNPVRLSYAFIAHPRKADDNGVEKYGALLMIPKEDKATLDALKAGVMKVFNENAGFFKGYSVKSLNPIMDGAEDTKTGKQRDELFKDFYVLNVSSLRQPKCIEKDSSEILDIEETIYSGCWAKVGIAMAPYKAPGGKLGIGCYLNLVKKMRDDTRLAGEVKEEDYWPEESGKKEEDDDLLL